MAKIHQIDNVSVRPRKVSLKHRLIVAEQVALFVALPMFALGAYVGYLGCIRRLHSPRHCPSADREGS